MSWLRRSRTRTRTDSTPPQVTPPALRPGELCDKTPLDIRTWKRTHPLAKPYGSLGRNERLSVTRGQQQMVAAAFASGDLVKLAGPDGSADGLTHTADSRWQFVWAEPADLGFGLTQGAAAWLSRYLEQTDTHGGSDVDLGALAWDLLPHYYAERYDLAASTMPAPATTPEGRAVLDDDGLCQLLYDYARPGFQLVVARRGHSMVDLRCSW